MSEISNTRVSQLSEELTKCTQQLHLAGDMGINLLDDKRKLEEEVELLRNQYSKLLEGSEKEKYGLQQRLWEEKNERDLYIAELEDEVQQLQQLLNDSKQAAELAEKEHLSTTEHLEETVRQLTYSLEKVTEEKIKLHSQLSALTCKLCEEEKNKEKLLLQHILQGKMDELQKENLQLKQQISGLQYSSSSLAAQLNLSQNDVTQMELQLEEKEELLIVVHQELQETQEIVKQLQLELNKRQTLQTSSCHNSISLFEEFHMTSESLVAQDAELASDVHESIFNCHSCVALTEKLKCYRKEMEKLNTQIINLVEQKLDLAQQLEMWEGDVECLVGDHVFQQLKDDKKKITRKSSGIMHYLSQGIKKVAGTNH